MILALDVGNTNIVVGCIDEDNIFFECRLSSDRNKTEAEYAVIFKNLLDVYDVDLSKIDGTIISSVVPPITDTLKNAVFTVTGYEPIDVSVKMNHGLKFSIDNPEIGNDLLVGAVAGLEKFKPPLIIFDLGTATTISVIDKSSVFCGCAFIPGIKISLNALAEKTAQLPQIDLTAPEHVIGKNTVDAMQSGMLYGTASMMDGMIDRIEEELGEKTTVLATGGLASFVIPHCKHQIHLDDDLLLKGLWVLYNKNKD